jgi:hypothetical protein
MKDTGRGGDFPSIIAAYLDDEIHARVEDYRQPTRDYGEEPVAGASALHPAKVELRDMMMSPAAEDEESVLISLFKTGVALGLGAAILPFLMAFSVSWG